MKTAFLSKQLCDLYAENEKRALELTRTLLLKNIYLNAYREKAPISPITMLFVPPLASRQSTLKYRMS